jgi:hypothetical protein
MGAFTHTIRQLTTGGSTTDASSFATASITGRINELMILAVMNSHGTSATLPTVTGWTQIATVTFGTSFRVTMFHRQSSSVVSGAQTIDFGGTTQTGCRWQIVGFTQALIDIAGNGAAAIGQTGTNTSSAAALTINYGGTVAPISAGYSAIARSDSNATITARSNWANSADAGHASPTTRFVTARRLVLNTETAGGTTTTITGGGIVIEVKLNVGLLIAPETTWRRKFTPILVR